MEKQATFKKSMFGFEKESVIAYIDALYNDSRQEIAELEKNVQELGTEKTRLQSEIATLRQKLVETESKLEEEKGNAHRFADGIRSLNMELNRMKLDNGHKDYRIKELTAKIEDYEKREEQLKAKEAESNDLLLKARQQADELLQAAKLQQEQLLGDAKEQQAAIIENAQAEKAELLRGAESEKAEMLEQARLNSEEMEKTSEVFRKDLMALRNSVRGLLAEMDRSLGLEAETVSAAEMAQEPVEENKVVSFEKEETVSEISAEENFFRTAARACCE